MKWIFWILLAFAPLTGLAGPLEDTVLIAYRDIQKLPHHDIWEYGGIIVERYGQIMFPAIPTTEEKNDRVLIDVHSLMLPSDKLLAVYHTHPCLPAYYSDLFSINDIIQQDYFGVPSFILDGCKKQIHEFQFGVDRIFDTGRTVHLQNGKKIHLPAGRIVGRL